MGESHILAWSNPEFVDAALLNKSGAFGEIYKATHIKPSCPATPVAVKKISVEVSLLHFEGDFNKIRREIEYNKRLQALAHPNMVRYLGNWMEGRDISKF